MLFKEIVDARTHARTDGRRTPDIEGSQKLTWARIAKLRLKAAHKHNMNYLEEKKGDIDVLRRANSMKEDSDDEDLTPVTAAVQQSIFLSVLHAQIVKDGFCFIL